MNTENSALLSKEEACQLQKLGKVKVNETESGSFLAREINSHSVLADDEIAKLHEKMRAGDGNAREKLCLHNLRLVASLANKYSRMYRVLFDDLFQAGCEGLMEAVDRFDPAKGKLSTYAYLWIRRYVWQELDTRSQVHLPNSFLELRRNIARSTEKLQGELGRHPTLREIADRAGCKKEDVIEIQDGFGNAAFSLDQFATIDGNSTFADFVADESVRDPATALLVKEGMTDIPKKILDLMDILEDIPEKRALIFRSYYGLTADSSGARISLDELGARFGMTGERVRQICNRIWRIAHIRFPKLGIDHQFMVQLRRDNILFEEVWQEVCEHAPKHS